MCYAVVDEFVKHVWCYFSWASLWRDWLTAWCDGIAQCPLLFTVRSSKAS